MTISQDLTGVVLDHKKVNVDFIYWLLSNHTSKLKSLAQGSTIKRLFRKEIENLKLPLPPLPEQHRIAEILTTADTAIRKVDDAIAKTERLKRGLMQELLTKGIGHEEFKDSEGMAGYYNKIGMRCGYWGYAKQKTSGILRCQHPNSLGDNSQ